MSPRHRELTPWPPRLQWYDRSRYEGAQELPPVVWLSLLSERARAASAPPEEARAMIQRFQTSPLTVATAYIPLERPVAAVGFEDGAVLLSQMSHPAAAAELQTWAEAPSPAARVLEAVFGSGRSAAADPSLHDLMMQEFAKNPGRDPIELALHRAYVRFDLRLPDTELRAQFDALLKDLRTSMKTAGITFGSAPRRARHSTGHVGARQIRGWAQFRVLDYLDIQLTCRLEGMRMPSAEVVGKELFPSLKKFKGGGKVDTADRVRLHTRPEAARIVRRAFLESFAAQVAAIAVNQKSPEI